MSEKSTKSAQYNRDTISARKNQILQCMEIDMEYSITEIAAPIGLKGSRTRRLLNELIELDVLTRIDTNKNRI